MSGRGCTITIEVLGGSGVSDNVEELHLPVALHSPLEVLKEQLEQLVGISMESQVLILLDLTDPERNRDVQLIGRDHESLRTCGIRNGSVLTLHALGLPAEKKQKLTKDAVSKKKPVISVETEKTYSLVTDIGPKEADHSYNGIIFDILCKSPFEVDITSISIGGMLGRVRIFYRNRPWEADKPERRANHHWWAHRDSVSNKGWVLLADTICSPSWDRPFEIKFNKSVTMHPNAVYGFYCHSSLPDDLGIQYQSYHRDDIVAEDEHISIHPGVGHTGSEPFDETSGWYRSYRGLSGIVNYRRRLKGWTLFSHSSFPAVLKNSVLQLLLCNNHNPKQSQVYKIYDMDNYDSHNNNTTCSNMISSSRSVTKCSNYSNRTIGSLPIFLIYNILEYMHWDWFQEVYPDEYDYMMGSTSTRYLFWKDSKDPINPLPLLNSSTMSETSTQSPSYRSNRIAQMKSIVGRVYNTAVANPTQALLSYLTSSGGIFEFDSMNDDDEYHDNEYVDDDDDEDEEYVDNDEEGEEMGDEDDDSNDDDDIADDDDVIEMIQSDSKYVEYDYGNSDINASNSDLPQSSCFTSAENGEDMEDD